MLHRKPTENRGFFAVQVPKVPEKYQRQLLSCSGSRFLLHGFPQIIFFLIQCGEALDVIVLRHPVVFMPQKFRDDPGWNAFRRQTAGEGFTQLMRRAVLNSAVLTGFSKLFMELFSTNAPL